MDLISLKKTLAQIIYSDGYLEQAQLKNGDADVLFLDWEDRTWCFKFTEVVFFRCYELGGHVEGVSVSDTSPDIANAITVIEQGGGDRAGYLGIVQATFTIDGIPVLTVVFQDLTIESA